MKQELGKSWLPSIYRDRLLKMRTRSYKFENLKKSARVEIQHTLLGVELKIGKRRLCCPDLATARYLAVFARAGCSAVAVPYDITKVSKIADELESAWYRMLLLADHKAGGKDAGARVRGLLIGSSPRGGSGIGPGCPHPGIQTNHQTKALSPIYWIDFRAD